MKKLLPLLILVGCANDQVMSEAYSSCVKSLYKAEDEKHELSIQNTQLAYELFKIKQLSQGKPILVALPEPRPVLNLRDCVYHDRKSYCAEIKNRGPWYGFDCVQPSLKDGRFYCDSSKCLTITSDESECAL